MACGRVKFYHSMSCHICANSALLQSVFELQIYDYENVQTVVVQAENVVHIFCKVLYSVLF